MAEAFTTVFTRTSRQIQGLLNGDAPPADMTRNEALAANIYEAGMALINTKININLNLEGKRPYMENKLADAVRRTLKNGLSIDNKDALEAYLNRMYHNIFKDGLRSARSRQKYEVPIDPDIAFGGAGSHSPKNFARGDFHSSPFAVEDMPHARALTSIEKKINTERRISHVERALAGLPEAQRHAFSIYRRSYETGESVKQICMEEGIPEGTVKGQFHRLKPALLENIKFGRPLQSPNANAVRNGNGHYFQERLAGDKQGSPGDRTL
jgi:RNA polymerase sigma factor (sigma-70 family)